MPVRSVKTSLEGIKWRRAIIIFPMRKGAQIHALRKRADSLREIARQLGRSPSTISRELHRNSGGRGYRYQQATPLGQRAAEEGIVASTEDDGSDVVSCA